VALDGGKATRKLIVATAKYTAVNATIAAVRMSGLAGRDAMSPPVPLPSADKRAHR
jgi:hypothetical protein